MGLVIAFDADVIEGDGKQTVIGIAAKADGSGAGEGGARQIELQGDAVIGYGHALYRGQNVFVMAFLDVLIGFGSFDDVEGGRDAVSGAKQARHKFHDGIILYRFVGQSGGDFRGKRRKDGGGRA
jgi:hypothetical protein